jgi:hypothetical protein
LYDHHLLDLAQEVVEVVVAVAPAIVARVQEGVEIKLVYM